MSDSREAAATPASQYSNESIILDQELGEFITGDNGDNGDNGTPRGSSRASR